MDNIATPPEKFPLSVLIPVLNERRNIEACLESVQWCDDLVVVDSGSVDGTDAIAEGCGASVVQFRYIIGGPKKKNWTLANVRFKNDWVLILDADERITPELAREIRHALMSPGDVTGYYINRRFMFMGKWIRHCGYFPSWNLRLLKRGCGAYEMLPSDENNVGDNEVHEHVILASGSSSRLDEPMDHYAFPTIESFVEKHNRYSNWEATVGDAYYKRAASSSDKNGISTGLRFRRLLKSLARALPCPHWMRFFYHYIFRAGFLDGKEGYIFCHLLGEYEFLIWAKRLAATAHYSSSATPRAIAPRLNQNSVNEK